MFDEKWIELKIPTPFDTTRLKKFLKSSTVIGSVNISELRFNELDWATISKGIGKNESVTRLRFHSVHVNQNNITYIVGMLQRNKRIESLRFDTWTIQQDSFDILCQVIRDMPSLKEIEISSNNLTQEQILKLKLVFDTSKTLQYFIPLRDPVSSHTIICPP